MTTLMQAIVAGNTPLYSHQLIGSRRTGVPRSRPLAHPARIGARKRVRRSLNERIRSAYEQRDCRSFVPSQSDKVKRPGSCD